MCVGSDVKKNEIGFALMLLDGGYTPNAIAELWQKH